MSDFLRFYLFLLGLIVIIMVATGSVALGTGLLKETLGPVTALVFLFFAVPLAFLLAFQVAMTLIHYLMRD